MARVDWRPSFAMRAEPVAGTIDDRLARLDVSVFDRIPSQSTMRDRRSLLACQVAVRQRHTCYAYLEIGSYRGGSLQPHVLDPACTRIFSIDSRPDSQPDEGGVRFTYRGNTADRMLESLEAIAPGARDKITTFDSPAAAVPPSAIDPAPRLCFIDGEHTDVSLAADFAFCRRVLAPGGLILCHDAPVVYNGLATLIADLERSGTPHRAAYLPDTIVAVEFGGEGLLDLPVLAEVRADTLAGYLFSLRYNDHYRRLANRWPLRAYRRLRVWWSGVNQAE